MRSGDNLQAPDFVLSVWFNKYKRAQKNAPEILSEIQEKAVIINLCLFIRKIPRFKIR